MQLFTKNLLKIIIKENVKILNDFFNFLEIITVNKKIVIT